MTRLETPQARVQAAAAQVDITPQVGIYHRMWGAAMHDRATGVHRPLMATLLRLEPFGGPRSEARVLVGLDHCILDADEIARIRNAVSECTGVGSESIHVALSHTHGAGFMTRSRSHLPGGDMIGPYLDSVAQTIARLAIEASERVEPATIVYGQGRCSLAQHRDFFDEARGHFVCGFNPGGPADDTLLVARIASEQNAPIATLVNYACHPTTLAWDNALISPDFIGSLRETIEEATAAPCLFLQGASGDLGPREGFVGDVEVADRNGRQLAYAALATLESLPPGGTHYEYAGSVLSGTWIGTWRNVLAETPRLEGMKDWKWRQFTVPLPYRRDLPTLAQTLADREQWQSQEAQARAEGNDDRMRECRAKIEQLTRQVARLEHLPPGEAYPLEMHLARLGDGLWLFVPGELYQLFQTSLRTRFPSHPLIVSTVTNNWQPGYIPQENVYGKGIYQDVIACVAPGSLETLMEATAREIEAMLESR
jgi:hypothetical protein